MTHRDGLPRFSVRSGGRGDAAHREARATPSEILGKPPFRPPSQPVGGRRKALPMGRHRLRPFSDGPRGRSHIPPGRSLGVIVTAPWY